MKAGKALVVIFRRFIRSGLVSQARGNLVPQVSMTAHLYRFFPQFKGLDMEVESGSVKQALLQLETRAPGFLGYLLDDHGALRRHVNVCINDRMLIDRQQLSDQLKEGDTLFIFQALSGG